MTIDYLQGMPGKKAFFYDKRHRLEFVKYYWDLDFGTMFR